MDVAGTTREPEVRAVVSTVGHGAELHDPPVVAAADESYMSDEEVMESDTAFSQRFTAKHLREVAKIKLNPSKRRYINETAFGDLTSISPFTVPHDLMEWLTMNIDTDSRELRLSRTKVIVFTRDMVKKVFNIPSGNRPVELFKRHEHCELHNIYHKNGRASIAHTVDVLHRARNDDGDTTKRSWVLLALATVLNPSTGNMVPLEYLESLEEMDKVTEFAWDEHVLSVAMREVKKCQDKIKSQATSSFWVGGCFPMLAFRPLSKIPYAALPAQGPVGNNSEVAQDQQVSDSPDCDDTQDCGAGNININDNQDDVAAKENPTEGSNPTDNGKSTDEDVCGSLDDCLQNPAPFGAVLELPSHMAAIYDKHTKLYDAKLKGAPSSYRQVLQAIHCKRMEQLLKDVHVASSSSQEAVDVTFDVSPPHSNVVDKSDGHGCSKESSREKVVDEPTTDKVFEPAEGARSNCASSIVHEPNGGDVVELGIGTSAVVSENLARCFETAKEKVSSGEDTEHGHQLSQRNHSVPTSVAGHWSDVPSMSVFQEGTEEYEWWISVPNVDANSNAPTHGNTVTTPKSCDVFYVTPQAPISTEAEVPVYDVTPTSVAPLSSGTADGPSKPQEEPVVLVSSREPSPDLNEEKLKSKDEKKLKSKKRVGSPMSAGSKYKKIKTDSKTEAMYQYYVMKRYKMKKMKRGEIEPPFIRNGDFHITYTNFQKSLKPRAQICNEVMSLFVETFNIEQLSSSHKQKKFAFSVLMILQLSVHPEVFDPSVCARELRRACQNFQISVFDLLFFTILRDGHWIVCVVNLLHKEFNMFDSLDNGKFDVAARNLFTNFKRIATEEPDFKVDLSSFKPNWPLLDYPQQATQ
uniref:Ubiquitin-like protease family profile domain-containing protein n=1 Tax=Aegilops tauschii subsp. strangulata TaxID=200361 RepID=A0A453FHX7_AEGTS